MQHTVAKSEIRKLRLSLRAYGCGEENEIVGDTIRTMPGVFRVEAKPERHEMSIWFKHPTPGLLGKIDNSLRLFGCGVAGGEVS